MSPVEALIRRMQMKVTLNPGATADELESLHNLLGSPLPDDVRTFYSLANGMPDLNYDHHEVSFWSIEKMRTQRTRWPNGEVGFADFLIDSWSFIFLPSARGVVVATENVEPGNPPREIGTFTSFADIYLRAPEELGVL
jgi:hypothetical protein